MNSRIVFIYLLIFSVTLAGQSDYKFKNETLPAKSIPSPSVMLHYSSDVSDVCHIGMGKVQTAMRMQGVGMRSNPAFLAQKENRIDVFSIQAAFPPSTWEAAWFLEDHMDEFTEAVSLNQIYDGVDAFFEKGITLQERWDALHQIQDGLAFVVNLMNEVTGPPEAPQRHGFSILPRFGAQFGNLGVSLYGYGQANFIVRQSSTLDALVDIDIPEDLDNPLSATKSILQIMSILGSGIIEDNQSFSQEILPVAFYLSYIDVIGTVGYGKNIWKELNAGAALKVINRRFSINRIPVVDYDEIIDNAFSDLSQSVTGITLDLGMQTRLPFGTNIGLCLMNILPLQTLNDEISMDFIHHSTGYDIDNGDTTIVRYKRPVELILPFELKLPFCANLGIYHDFNRHLSLGMDWQDIFENESRYQSTGGRLRFGGQYEQPVWSDKLTVTGRLGFGDEHVCGGLGIEIYKAVILDGAYAWDPIIESYAYHTQLRIVL